MNWPRLSETLTGPRHPQRCQCCGCDETLTRWIECDRADEPTHVAVVLCRPCGHRLIEPHPRLYIATESAVPIPGCMALCVDCRHRDGVVCLHPGQKRLGGQGLAIHCPQPIGIACSRGKGGGCRRLYSPGAVPTKCEGCEVEVKR